MKFLKDFLTLYKKLIPSNRILKKLIPRTIICKNVECGPETQSLSSHWASPIESFCSGKRYKPSCEQL